MDFVPINGYEGKYSVNKIGRVKSVKKSRLLKPIATNVDKHGLYYNLYKDGLPKKKFAHRLVAEHFMDGFTEDKIVGHIDGDKTNNCPANLLIADSKYQIERYKKGEKIIEHLRNTYDELQDVNRETIRKIIVDCRRFDNDFNEKW